MPWIETDKHKPGWLEWVEPTPASAATAIISAIAGPTFNVGDKLIIHATVSGQKQRHVNVVLDDVPADMIRTFTLPATALAIASRKAPAPYLAPDTDAA